MRLPPIVGEWIDRTTPLAFEFAGKPYQGYAGDCITSALLANDQWILGRSFKYHRPRSVLSLANHDINTLVQWGDRPNVRADVTPLQAGMQLQPVNVWGSVSADLLGVLDWLSPFLPVGFYYKTFHGKLFPFWERVIRTITGLGRVDFTTPHIRTPKAYDFCDVLVIGGGIAGLQSALTCAEGGVDVLLVEENPHLGGSGLYDLAGDQANAELARDLVQRVKRHGNIRVLTDTVAIAYYADHWVPLLQKERIIKLRAKSVIVATGAYEQPAVFRNNDLPKVMLSSAAQRLIYRYAVSPAQQAVVLAGNQFAYRSALDLHHNGTVVEAIVDLRPTVPEDEATNRVRSLGIPIFRGHAIYEAIADLQTLCVKEVVLCPWREGAVDPRRAKRIRCDGVLMGVGYAPANNLLYQAGVSMRYVPQIEQYVPHVLPAGVFACGRVNGVYDPEEKRKDGDRAGEEALMYLGIKANATHIPISLPAVSPSHPYPITPHPKGKNFVDCDEDLQLKDYFNAVQEGFSSVELLKRYSTNGMGPSQGKHSNMNAIRILAHIHQRSIPEIGTTTARPLVQPVPLSHLAGRGFQPERHTALHRQHQQLSAQFTLMGDWLRPAYYAQEGKGQEQCIQEEVLAVRQGVGLIDVSSLGKIEILGSSAGQFLERVYTGKFANMKIGTVRYAVLLDKAGTVIDDGVVARLAEEHFYCTTTSSGAGNVYRELVRLNTMWRMDCTLVNATGARSAINIAGKQAVAVLRALTDMDLSPEAFPYLAVRQGLIAGVPAIAMRVGFVGEWGYEIHIPADYAEAVWQGLMEAGKALGIRAFGVEAQRVLRLEKGHIIVGQDTDGLTHPYQVGLQWAVKMDKPFFVGQRSLQIIQKQPQTQQLVGFTLSPDYTGTAPQECHLVIQDGEIAGRVTSIAYSPTLQQYIGLAFVSPHLAEIGQKLAIRLSDGVLVTATVSPTPFYDRENQAQQLCTPQPDLPKLSLTCQPTSPIPVPEQEINGMRITDISLEPKIGWKGQDSIPYLLNRGLTVPTQPNTWQALPTGGLLARLGLGEFLLCDAVLVETLQGMAVSEGRVYPVLRQDAGLQLKGDRLWEVLCQVCSLNWRSINFNARPLFLTTMAGVNVLVIPTPEAVKIWCDRSYGSYLYQTLVSVCHDLA